MRVIRVAALVIIPDPGQLMLLTIMLILTPLSGFFAAEKTLVALDDPYHITTDEADLKPQELILLSYLVEVDRKQVFRRFSSRRIKSLNDLSALDPIAFQRQRWNGYLGFYSHCEVYRMKG